MQRLFSMFPYGLPGLALFLLRFSMALALLCSIRHSGWISPGWVYLAAVPVMAGLCAGLLTPLTALVALSLHIVIWALTGVPDSGMAASIALESLALALLGPGAYSMDARRFGRRVIEISK